MKAVVFESEPREAPVFDRLKLDHEVALVEGHSALSVRGATRTPRSFRHSSIRSSVAMCLINCHLFA